MRERGLKLHKFAELASGFCRSREGAWIEIISRTIDIAALHCRSREGAWIEINSAAIGYNLLLLSLP